MRVGGASLTIGSERRRCLVEARQVAGLAIAGIGIGLARAVMLQA